LLNIGLFSGSNFFIWFINIFATHSMWVPSTCVDIKAYHHNKCRTCAASRRSSSTLNCVCVYLENMGRQGILVFISVKKIEWESPPSILVTRNPNWSQRLGMETGCVKGRY
jgi:hypothetical protein